MKVAILITISLCIASVLADEKRDGDWWCAQSEKVKVAYVLGALDHAAGHAALADPLNLRAQTTLSTAQIRNVCRHLDLLYGTGNRPTNRTMQVQSALPLVLIWITAGPDATLESAMQKMREQSAPR